MKVSCCQPDHFEKIQYYVSSINLAVCPDCHSKYVKDGYECTSIGSMGNAYLYDVKSIKDKWAVVYDDICAKQAKYLLLYEKLCDSIVGSFESYINEVIKVKESILNEANSEKSKFLQNYDIDVIETKNKIKSETDNLSSHIQNIENFLNTSVHHLLLPLIDTIDVPSKVAEIDRIRNSLDKILLKEVQLPFMINRKQYSKDFILSQIEIIKNNYISSLEKPVREISQQIQVPNEQITDSQPIQTFHPTIERDLIPEIPEKSFNVEINNRSPYYVESSEAITPLEASVTVIKTPPKLNPIIQESPTLEDPPKISPLKKQINNLMLHYINANKLYIYDINNEKKYIIDTPPPEVFPSKYFPSIILRDSIFLCGGSSPEVSCLRTTFTFDYNTMEFIQRKSMPSARCKHSIANIANTYVYVIGGFRAKNSLKECSKYDIDQDKWIYVPPLNEENCLSTTFSFRNRLIYSIGGMNNSLKGYIAAVERLDITNEEEGWKHVDFRTNGWSARFGMNNCQLSDQYFLIFGGANITIQNHCFLYDCESDTLMFISRLQQGAKFENQQAQPILYKDMVYAVDDEKNLQMFHVRSNTWTIAKWSEWKPNVSKAPYAPKNTSLRKSPLI